MISILALVSVGTLIIAASAAAANTQLVFASGIVPNSNPSPNPSPSNNDTTAQFKELHQEWLEDYSASLARRNLTA